MGGGSGTAPRVQGEGRPGNNYGCDLGSQREQGFGLTLQWHWPAASHWLLRLPLGSQPQPIGSGRWPSPEVEGSHSWNLKAPSTHPHLHRPLAIKLTTKRGRESLFLNTYQTQAL